MKVGVAALLLLAVLLASVSACGSEPMDAGLNDLPKKDAAACLSDDQIGAGRVLTSADLDGDGAPEPVQYSGVSGSCSQILFARADGKRYGVKVDGDLPVRSAAAIGVAGRSGQLVVVRQTHPRGGFQVRLFGFADHKLEELKVSGQPILPFAATDTGDILRTARCDKNGVTVATAKRSSKRTWDVSQTSYLISGNAVTAGSTEDVARDLSDVDLRQRYPALVAGSLFADCT